MYLDKNICINDFCSFPMSEIDIKFNYRLMYIKFIVTNCLSIEFSSRETENSKEDSKMFYILQRHIIKNLFC